MSRKIRSLAQLNDDAVLKDGSVTMTGALNVPSGATGTQVAQVQEVVKKSGDTMTGALSVPSGAITTQVPQVQEVVKKSGDTMTGNLEAPTMTIGGEVVYHESNIIGTVSQSLGVPTGAIIESGSNVNGSYIKYADGTMICWADDLDITLSAVSAVSISHTFPAVFAVAPYSNYYKDSNAAGWTTSNDRIKAIASGRLASTTTASGIVSTGDNTAFTGTAGKVGYIVLGKWF